MEILLLSTTSNSRVLKQNQRKQTNENRTSEQHTMLVKHGGQNLKHEKFWFEWSNSGTDFPLTSLEIFRTWLTMILSNLLQLDLLCVGPWTLWPIWRSFSTYVCDSVKIGAFIQEQGKFEERKMCLRIQMRSRGHEFLIRKVFPLQYKQLSTQD